MIGTFIDKEDRSGYVAIEYDGRTDLKKIIDLKWIVKKRNRTDLKKITNLERSSSKYRNIDGGSLNKRDPETTRKIARTKFEQMNGARLT